MIVTATELAGGGSLTIERSTITNGGGVGSAGYTLIRDLTISGCYYGVYVGIAAATRIENTTINNNSDYASNGGGILNYGRVYLTNVTLSGNVARNDQFSGGYGGGIYNASDSQAVITNCTITKNRATRDGGGIFQTGTAEVIIRNSIVSGNVANFTYDAYGVLNSHGYNIFGTPTGFTGWIQTDRFFAGAGLAPLGNNGGPTLTHAVLSSSPALNTGSRELALNSFTNEAITRDQRGYSRILCQTTCGVDVGAFQTQQPAEIRGRILNSSGRAVFGFSVIISDLNGEIFFSRTNLNGNYRFLNLVRGTTYTITANKKTVPIASRTLTLDQPFTNLNFTAP